MSTGIDVVKKRLANKSARVQMFMSSELGREIIKVLEEEFCEGTLYALTDRDTAFNLGRRDVVMYLKQLQRWKKDV